MPDAARVGTMAASYGGSNDRQHDFLDRSLNPRAGSQGRPGTGTGVNATHKVFNPFQTDKQQEPLNYSQDAPKQQPLQPAPQPMQQQELMQSNKAAALYGNEKQFSESLAPRHMNYIEPEPSQH